MAAANGCRSSRLAPIPSIYFRGRGVTTDFLEAELGQGKPTARGDVAEGVAALW